MANTTDIILTVMEDDLIPELEKLAELSLNKISSSEKCSGEKIVSFESFAGCYRCIGDGLIKKLIDAFYSINFIFPEYAVLMISDDNDSVYQGTYIHAIKNRICND